MIDGHEIAYGARHYLLGEQLRSFVNWIFRMSCVACSVLVFVANLVIDGILSSIAIEIFHARVNCQLS